MGEELFEGSPGLSSAAEPSYLRRQKRVETRKRGSRWGVVRRTRRILPAVLLVGFSCYAVWKAASFLLNDSRFYLSGVHVLGGKFVPQSEVEGKFVSDKDKSILRVPLSRRQHEIAQIPWVRSATVERVFPNQLWVRVEERVPVAFVWTSGGVSLLDEEGILLDLPPEATFTFPVVRGISELDSPAERRAKMRLFVAVMSDLGRGGDPLREQISEVDLTDREDARVVIADSVGAVLLHLGTEDFLSRYLTYAAHIAEWRQKFTNIQSVDLRFEGQVVVNADPQPGLQEVSRLQSSLAQQPPNGSPLRSEPANPSDPRRALP